MQSNIHSLCYIFDIKLFVINLCFNPDTVISVESGTGVPSSNSA